MFCIKRYLPDTPADRAVTLIETYSGPNPMCYVLRSPTARRSCGQRRHRLPAEWSGGSTSSRLISRFGIGLIVLRRFVLGRRIGRPAQSDHGDREEPRIDQAEVFTEHHVKEIFEE